MKARLLLLLITGCSSLKPCYEGVINPRKEEDAFSGMAIRKCQQRSLKDGRVLNHGDYSAWDASEQIRVVGRYFNGVKQGKWIFYDAQGKKILFFEKGVEVPDFKQVTVESELAPLP
jgi:hypothetical protein